MKTSVNMIRKMGKFEVTQRTKDEKFNATYLLNQWNKGHNKQKLLKDFLRTQQTKEFIEAIKEEESPKALTPDADFQVVTVIRGRNTKQGRTPNTTWMHPYLFIDFAMWLNPKFKVKVIKFVYDGLMKMRNDSGDSYKQMTAVLYKKHKNKFTFPDYIIDVANKVRLSCDVEDWQEATEAQLKKRDKIHVAIATLIKAEIKPKKAIKLAITKL